MTRATNSSTVHDTNDYQTTRRSRDSASTRLTFRVNLMQGHDEAAYARRQKSETGQNAKNKIKIRGNCSLALSPFLPSSLPPSLLCIHTSVYGSMDLSIYLSHTDTPTLTQKHRRVDSQLWGTRRLQGACMTRVVFILRPPPEILPHRNRVATVGGLERMGSFCLPRGKPARDRCRSAHT